ncbi:MAG TPA: cupin domain-containing protein [Candidatus Limnocylindria bacterium]|nr:cupin domain-containing protein [Candidatus Limnocylindria bacterium]
MTDEIDNPVTGERIRFLRRDGATRAEPLRMDFSVAPHGFVAAPHVHPHQGERSSVDAGVITFRIGGRDVRVATGQSVTVPPGTPHVWSNPSDQDARVLVELQPALRMEPFFRQWFGLARDGKVDAHGMPSLLQLAVVMREYRNEIQPPVLLQRLLLVPLAFVARLMGYRANDPRYQSAESGGSLPA